MFRPGWVKNMAILKKSLIGASPKVKADGASAIKPAAESSTPAKSPTDKRLALARMATAKLSTASLKTLKRLT
jgi:hypothetical protein